MSFMHSIPLDDSSHSLISRLALPDLAAARAWKSGQGYAKALRRPCEVFAEGLVGLPHSGAKPGAVRKTVRQGVRKGVISVHIVRKYVRKIVYGN